MTTLGRTYPSWIFDVSIPDGLSAGVGKPLRIDNFASTHVAPLDTIVRDSPLAQIVGTVLNSPVRFYMDQVFYKPAGKLVSTPWHQDTCYYNVAGHDMIRAWVSPDPSTDPQGAALAAKAFENGEAVIGADAHEGWSYGDAFTDPPLPALPDIEAYRDSFDIIGWDYEPGDVTSTNPRRAQASMWAGNDVHYQHRRGQVIPDPIALYELKPSSGDALERFPSVFPLIWAPD